MKTSVAFLLLLALVLPCEGAGWNQFRGPNASGVASPACKPPLKPDTESLVWKTAVPSGHSSPVIAGNRIFLTGITGDEKLVTLAIDRNSGKEVWRKPCPDFARLEKVHETGSPAASTPCADEERLIVYFGSYGLLCYDHAGGLLWSKPIPTPKSLYGMSSSPVMHGDLVIMLLDNDENLEKSKLSQSRIMALDKKTGETIWETARPMHRSGWSTPVVWEDTVVVLGHGRVCGYDLKTGTEKWFAGGFSRETVTVPVTGNGHIFVSSAQLGGGADADIDPEPFWDAIIGFDKDGDGKIARAEMTGDFTMPLRPEYPPGHPGFGIPLPDDPGKREQRRDGLLKWVDKDNDGAWSREEFEKSMSFRKGKPLLMAIRPGGSGDIADTHVSWELNRGIPEVPSPLYFDKRIYLVRNGGFITAVDAENGDLIYRERLEGGGGYSASPVVASGHLFAVSNRGVLSVVKPGDTFAKLHTFDLGDTVSATPAVDEDSLYVRTGNHLCAFRDLKPANVDAP